MATPKVVGSIKPASPPRRPNRNGHYEQDVPGGTASLYTRGSFRTGAQVVGAAKAVRPKPTGGIGKPATGRPSKPVAQTASIARRATKAIR